MSITLPGSVRLLRLGKGTGDGNEVKADLADTQALKNWKNGVVVGDGDRTVKITNPTKPLPRNVKNNRGIDTRFLTPLDRGRLVGGKKAEYSVAFSSTHVVPPLLKSFFGLSGIKRVIWHHFDQVLNPTVRQQMGDILSGSDGGEFAALGQFLLQVVQASLADSGPVFVGISRALGRCMGRTARSMSRDMVIALFLLVLVVERSDTPEALEPVDDWRSIPPTGDGNRERADTIREAMSTVVRLVSGFVAPGVWYGRPIASAGSLDTGGPPRSGFLFSANEKESVGFFETELATNSHIQALGRAAGAFVIARGKDKEAANGIREVYAAMAKELIRQDDTLTNEATFFRHLLAWRCTGTITVNDLEALNVAGDNITKMDRVTLDRFLKLVDRPPVEKLDLASVASRIGFADFDMTTVSVIFNGTVDFETGEMTGTDFADVLDLRADLIGGLRDPLSVFGPSPMLSLGAV